MIRIFISLIGLLFLAMQTALAPNIWAQSSVFGDSGGAQCYQRVSSGDMGRPMTLRDCQKALKSPSLTFEDKAATHVNLGILYMRAGQNEKARIQFSAALTMTPRLPEAYINDSAALIYLGNHQEAVSAINHAIELGTTKMPEALYNRSMAYHHLKEYRKAYKDLKQALVLRPDWGPALLSLEKYDVVPAK